MGKQCSVYTVCHSVCIVWTHYSMVEPHSSNFRVITTKFFVSEYLGNLRWILCFKNNFMTFFSFNIVLTEKAASFIYNTSDLESSKLVSCGPRQANLILTAYASNDGSGESAHPRSLARTSAARSNKQGVGEEPSGRKPYPWPLWKAGHAQLKFVMTECSKTQIRLTHHMYFNVV